MRAASDFEFKNRFWIIGGIFCFAFLTYNLDHQNAGAAVVEWLARLRGTEATNASYHAIFWFAALLCVMAAWVRTWATAYLNPEVMMGPKFRPQGWWPMGLIAMCVIPSISGTSCWPWDLGSWPAASGSSSW